MLVVSVCPSARSSLATVVPPAHATAGDLQALHVVFLRHLFVFRRRHWLTDLTMFTDELAYLLFDWRSDEALARVNELLCMRGLGVLRDLGCFLADGVGVQLRRGRVVLVAARDLKRGHVLLVERDLLPFVPPVLFPRDGAEIPMFHFGIPLFLCRFLSWKVSFMQYLRLSANLVTGGLFVVGSMAGHSCSPNAERYVRESDGAGALVTTCSVLKGEQLTVSCSGVVVLPDWPGGTLLRRLWLLWWKGFWCGCDRCTGVECDSFTKLRAMSAQVDKTAIEQVIADALYAQRGHLAINDTLLKGFVLDRQTCVIHSLMTLFALMCVCAQSVLAWAALPVLLKEVLPVRCMCFAFVLVFFCGDRICSTILDFRVSLDDVIRHRA